MKDIEQIASQFARERPELVPVLRVMIELAEENEAEPSSGLGEFCRSWLAAKEPGTPRTLGIFANAGLIHASPRGSGSHRTFYVLADRAATLRGLSQRRQDDAGSDELAN